MYLTPEYVGKIVHCYGIAFSANYTSLMARSDLLIPTKSGQRKDIITKIPETFKLGIYRVKISFYKSWF